LSNSNSKKPLEEEWRGSALRKEAPSGLYQWVPTKNDFQDSSIVQVIKLPNGLLFWVHHPVFEFMAPVSESFDFAGYARLDEEEE